MVFIQSLEAYNALEDRISVIAKNIKPISFCEPTNEPEEKQKFLGKDTGNPAFTYKPLSYNTKETEESLKAIEIPDDDLGKIFEEKRSKLLLENRLIANLGKEDIVRQATLEIHGKPSELLVAYADELLKTIHNAESQKTVPSDAIKQALEKALSEYGLTDWKVEFTDKKLTTVLAGHKKITVSKERKFSDQDAIRLPVHEIGVHVLRAVNGYGQPLRIFALGLPGYLPTEEGLASYFEELTGVTDDETRRDYAGRVLAVDSVCKNLSFRQAFDRLKDYAFSNEQAWNLAVRAYRGGGYIKDHEYLQGYLYIRNFAEKERDFKTLYAGKIGIQHLPLANDLLKQGVLKEAKNIPSFLKSVS
jgi:uncharacterized protein (TIGR02421 family)